MVVVRVGVGVTADGVASKLGVGLVTSGTINEGVGVADGVDSGVAVGLGEIIGSAVGRSTLTEPYGTVEVLWSVD